MNDKILARTFYLVARYKPPHMNYPPEVLLLAKIAKPLGDPARMKILRHLCEHGETSLPNLQEYLRLHPKKVDEHLRLLKRSNLVDFYPGPTDRIYVLNAVEFRRHLHIIGEFLESLRHPGQDPYLSHHDGNESL